MNKRRDDHWQRDAGEINRRRKRTRRQGGGKGFVALPKQEGKYASTHRRAFFAAGSAMLPNLRLITPPLTTLWDKLVQHCQKLFRFIRAKTTRHATGICFTRRTLNHLSFSLSTIVGANTVSDPTGVKQRSRLSYLPQDLSLVPHAKDAEDNDEGGLSLHRPSPWGRGWLLLPSQCSIDTGHKHNTSSPTTTHNPRKAPSLKRHFNEKSRVAILLDINSVVTLLNFLQNAYLNLQISGTSSCPTLPKPKASGCV